MPIPQAINPAINPGFSPDGFAEADLTYPPSRQLPEHAGVVLGVEAVPYLAQMAFGGLIVEVYAPCGCVAYYDADGCFAKESTLEPCEEPDCDFQWNEATDAAIAMMLA